jgi:hypothetical protein
MIQRLVCESITASTYCNLLKRFSTNAQSNTVSSHIQVKQHNIETNCLLITISTNNTIYPLSINANQYAYKLPSTREVLSYFGHNVTTTSQKQNSLGQTLHRYLTRQLPSTHCIQVLACSTTIPLQEQGLPPPLPLNQSHNQAHVT